MLQTLKTEHPEIVQACFRQDNAGCYHCSNTVMALAYLEKEVGIKVARVDFSDLQGGKGAADRLAATCKCHIRIYINEGHNVSTAEEMKKALLSHGGISGVRVAIVQSFDNSSVVEQPKIPGITKLNNFIYTKDGLLAHRSYSIGKGKCIILQDQSGKLSKNTRPLLPKEIKSMLLKEGTRVSKFYFKTLPPKLNKNKTYRKQS